jgi:hypothetical protein
LVPGYGQGVKSRGGDLVADEELDGAEVSSVSPSRPTIRANRLDALVADRRQVAIKRFGG